jgi:hypothetical protein
MFGWRCFGCVFFFFGAFFGGQTRGVLDTFFGVGIGSNTRKLHGAAQTSGIPRICLVTFKN